MLLNKTNNSHFLKNFTKQEIQSYKVYFFNILNNRKLILTLFFFLIIVVFFALSINNFFEFKLGDLYSKDQIIYLQNQYRFLSLLFYLTVMVIVIFGSFLYFFLVFNIIRLINFLTSLLLYTFPFLRPSADFQHYNYKISRFFRYKYMGNYLTKFEFYLILVFTIIITIYLIIIDEIIIEKIIDFLVISIYLVIPIFFIFWYTSLFRFCKSRKRNKSLKLTFFSNETYKNKIHGFFNILITIIFLKEFLFPLWITWMQVLPKYIFLLFDAPISDTLRELHLSMGLMGLDEIKEFIELNKQHTIDVYNFKAFFELSISLSNYATLKILQLAGIIFILDLAIMIFLNFKLFKLSRKYIIKKIFNSFQFTIVALILVVILSYIIDPSNLSISSIINIPLIFGTILSFTFSFSEEKK
jgi:hypothetical protein